jgi:hypothetical protein
MGQAQDLRSIGHALFDFTLGVLPQLESKGHIVINRHVGIESIILKYHSNIAILWRHIIHYPTINRYLSFRNIFQPCNHSQCCRLAASGRPNEDHEFLVPDVKIDLIHNHDIFVEDLRDFA